MKIAPTYRDGSRAVSLLREDFAKRGPLTAMIISSVPLSPGGKSWFQQLKLWQESDKNEAGIRGIQPFLTPFKLKNWRRHLLGPDLKKIAYFSPKPLRVSPCSSMALKMNCGKLKAKNSYFFIRQKHRKSLGNHAKTVKKSLQICSKNTRFSSDFLWHQLFKKGQRTPQSFAITTCRR